MTHTTSTVVALEFSDTIIRYIRFTKKRTLMIPSEYVEIPIPRGDIREGEIVNRAHVTKVLSDLQKKYSIKQAFVVLPVESISITSAAIDAMVGVSTSAAARQLLLQEGGIDPKQASIAKRLAVHTKRGRYLQVAAAKNSVIEGFVGCCIDAQITPLSIEPMLQAVLSETKEDDSLRPSMVMMIGEHRTVMGMVVNGQVVDMQVIDEGRHSLVTTQLDGVYTVSLSTAAQRYAIEWGNNKKQKGLFGSLQQIFLAGEGATLPGYADFLSATLRIPVSEINPWEGWFSFDEVIPILPRDVALRYSAVIGAALGRKEINLLPSRYAVRLYRKKIIRNIGIVMLSFFLGVVAGGIFTTILFFTRLLHYITPVTQELERWIVQIPL